MTSTTWEAQMIQEEMKLCEIIHIVVDKTHNFSTDMDTSQENEGERKESICVCVCIYLHVQCVCIYTHTHLYMYKEGEKECMHIHTHIYLFSLILLASIHISRKFVFFIYYYMNDLHRVSSLPRSFLFPIFLLPSSFSFLISQLIHIFGEISRVELEKDSMAS